MKDLLIKALDKWTNHKKIEFSKLIVGFLMVNGSIWIYLSYALAYLGCEQIAETLSKAVVVEILGVFGLYAIKALFENISKNNTWPDKPSSENKDVDC
jgi:hypothetical protein